MDAVVVGIGSVLNSSIPMFGHPGHRSEGNGTGNMVMIPTGQFIVKRKRPACSDRTEQSTG